MNGNPVGMFTAGEETSSPTGTTLSPSSVPNGKKMSGTDGSVSPWAGAVNRDTNNNSTRIDRILLGNRSKSTILLEQLCVNWDSAGGLCVFILLTAAADVIKTHRLILDSHRETQQPSIHDVLDCLIVKGLTIDDYNHSCMLSARREKRKRPVMMNCVKASHKLHLLCVYRSPCVARMLVRFF